MPDIILRGDGKVPPDSMDRRSLGGRKRKRPKRYRLVPELMASNTPLQNQQTLVLATTEQRVSLFDCEYLFQWRTSDARRTSGAQRRLLGKACHASALGSAVDHALISPELQSEATTIAMDRNHVLFRHSPIGCTMIVDRHESMSACQRPIRNSRNNHSRSSSAMPLSG
eukprot:1150744-Amphidinium_carterae.1